MIPARTDLDLARLLDSRPRLWRGAEGLLNLLAAASVAEQPQFQRLAASLGSADDGAWLDLADWLKSWPRPSGDAEALSVWLAEAELLGLSSLGLAKLELKVDGADTTAETLAGLLSECEPLVVHRTDHVLLAGEAERRLRELRIEVKPWSWIQGGTVGRLNASDAPWREICELWVSSQLHSADAVLLTDRVRSDAKLLQVYRDVVAEWSSDIFVTLWNANWSLDVARSVDELDVAHRLLSVQLPHIASEIEVKQHVEGTWWSYPDGRSELVPQRVAEHRWHDDLLGEMLTRIHVSEPDAAQDAWHALVSLQRVANGEGSSRGEDVAAAVIEDLARGHLGGAIVEASACFENGTDLDGTTERLVDYAFEARVRLSEVLMRLSDMAVDVTAAAAALTEADEVHREHGSAVLVVSDDVYQSVSDGIPFDHAEWWGARARLDHHVPQGVVDGALQAIASASSERRTGTVISFPQPTLRHQSRHALSREVTKLAAATHDTLFTGLSEQPCAWLANGAGPTAGCVPVLLLDEKRGVGVVAELRIAVGDTISEHELWLRAPALQYVARQSIRDAYYAAASTTRMGAAPHSFARHRIELVVDRAALMDAEMEVDGRSLGLSAALAFASAWLERPISGDMAALGTVSPGGAVGPVHAVEQKVRSLRGVSGDRPVRVICASIASDEVRSGGGTDVPVSNLAEAAVGAGVALTELGSAPYGSVHDRLRATRDIVSDIKTGNLARHGAAATWAGVADDLRRLVDSLAKEKAAEALLSEARCMAALAYSHAGLLNDVHGMLRGVERPQSLGLEVRTLYDIVAVGGLVDGQSLSTDKGRAGVAALEADLAELRGSGETSMLGYAAGTLGRAKMHGGDVDGALPLLEEGVAHHLAAAPHESARSRVYLAMALRMSGDADTGIEELYRARRELETLTRDYSPEYEESCQPFLNYELARTFIAIDRPEDAIATATSALQQAPRAWWPRLGILRARAWALRMADDGAGADADVEAMRELAVGISPPYDELARRLIAEAEGFPILDGEVY
ncbi:MAG: hypothetical protein H6716_24480 [Polyangiaceae bacterium]|nr:hypothetical protein [Polyangiaceae bacterium]MCB9629744.1 hypothetical protein [Sandaracinaceae bacterium]